MVNMGYGSVMRLLLMRINAIYPYRILIDYIKDLNDLSSGIQLLYQVLQVFFLG